MKIASSNWAIGLMLLVLSMSFQTGWAQQQGTIAGAQNDSGDNSGDNASQQDPAGIGHEEGEGDGGGQGMKAASDGQMMHSPEERQAMMQRMQNMMQNGNDRGMSNSRDQGVAQVGQDAFASIQGIVKQLEADPETEWGKVNITALREHFIDMNNVTLYANVVATEIAGGALFAITGEERTLEAILNMVPAHAIQLNVESDLTVEYKLLENGVDLVVTGNSEDDTARIRGLGFMGILVLGDHHQDHHLAIARGDTEHQQASGHNH